MLSSKDPAESVVVEFKFDGELLSIGSAVVSVHPYRGEDQAPEAMLYGSPQIVGLSVLQRVQAGLSGVTYRLRCVATSNSDIIARSALLPVKTLIE